MEEFRDKVRELLDKFALSDGHHANEWAHIKQVVGKVLVHKKGLIATQLSVLEALVFNVDENIHPW